MSNDLVRTSRAGDEFHYRWTARRCLEMLAPCSLLQEIFVEGDAVDEAAGEYVLDVTETYSADSKYEKVAYQLKYTTTQKDLPFTVSFLENTLKGFVENWRDPQFSNARLKYAVVTNRPASQDLKDCIQQLAGGKSCRYPNIKKYLIQYTGLSGGELQEFFKIFEIYDFEEDLDVQYQKSRKAISLVWLDSVNNEIIDHLTAQIRYKAIKSHPENKITKEDILCVLGVVSEDDILPAPSQWDSQEDWIRREQFDDIFSRISSADKPVIVHASGGVGKTVLMRQLCSAVPANSVALIYDCFGAGEYRNPAKTRHQHHVAILQIVNELAAKGLCHFVIPRNYNCRQYLNALWKHIEEAVQNLRRSSSNAYAYIFIDAADNAIMAAQERGEDNFVTDLINSYSSQYCKLILSSRTERLNLIENCNIVSENIELASFNDNETLQLIGKKFSDATLVNAREVNAFSNSNPRVISNFLSRANTIAELKSFSSPGNPQSLDDFFNKQISNIFENLKKQYPQTEYSDFQAICQCLALLPPSVPEDVLAAAAAVSINLIKSFIAELGYPIWYHNKLVHFKDEPTETWFRGKYGQRDIDLPLIIKRLMPLGERFAYVAECIPMLLMQNNDFEKLEELAETKDGIPHNKPTEQRSIYLARLTYAVKAAIRLGHYKSVLKLAFLAGEESAGIERMTNLLQTQLHLTALLLTPSEIQNYVWANKFKSQWRGSSHLYSAALLSFADIPHASAISLLRSAHNWLEIYLKQSESEEKQNDFNFNNQLSDFDIYAFAYTILNLVGSEQCARFICSCEPKLLILKTTSDLIKSLYDFNCKETIEELIIAGKYNPYFILGANKILIEYGVWLDKNYIDETWNQLLTADFSLELPCHDYQQHTERAIIALCETAYKLNFSHLEIEYILDHYYFSKNYYYPDDFNKKRNIIFLRAITLKRKIKSIEITIENIIDEIKIRFKHHRISQFDIDRSREQLKTFLPLYKLRTDLLCNSRIPLQQIGDVFAKNNHFHYYDEKIIRYEKALLLLECISLISDSDCTIPLDICTENSLKDILAVDDFIRFAYIFYRQERNKIQLADTMMRYANECIEENQNEFSVEELSGFYVDLAKAFYCHNKEEAYANFSIAIEKLSKFGEDMVPRWEAINSLAENASANKSIASVTLLNLSNCAEFIRKNVVRDKYFDSYRATETLLKLSPDYAIATFCRRCARGVESLDQDFIKILEPSVNLGLIDGRFAWCLRDLFDIDGISRLLRVCLSKETSEEKKNSMLKDAVNIFCKYDMSYDEWANLNRIQNENCCFDARINHYMELTKREDDHHSSLPDVSGKKVSWADIEAKIDYNSQTWLSDAIKIYQDDFYSYGVESFATVLTNGVENNQACRILRQIDDDPALSDFEAVTLLKNIPSNWLQLKSVQLQLPEIIKHVVTKYSLDIANVYYDLAEWKNFGVSTEDITKSFLEGIVVNKTRSLYDEHFFAIIHHAANLLSPGDSEDLVNFGIGRFEKFITPEFADGKFSDTLFPKCDTEEAFAKLLWFFLGAPEAEIRWRAAHCVTNFCLENNHTVIQVLQRCYQGETIQAFMSPGYPFYEYHAKQYFLIALAKVAREDKEKIVVPQNFFEGIATNEEHILLKKYALDILLKLDHSKYSQLQRYIQSSFKSKKVSGYAEKYSDSPWHIQGAINKEINFVFFPDYKEHWLKYLGDVFGINKNQMEDLAKEIVARIRINDFNGHAECDPRQHIWQRRGLEYMPYKSEFPEGDTYGFYLAYHSLMILANKLLKQLPVIYQWDDEKPWQEWIDRFGLTLSNGCWLSDRRDAIPHFFFSEKVLSRSCDSADWLNIPLAKLLCGGAENGFVSICGDWHVRSHENSLHCKIESVLIDVDNEESLLQILQNAENPYEYWFPYYSEDPSLTKTHIGNYSLEGFVQSCAAGNPYGSDSFDLHGGKISYTHYQLDDELTNIFKLVPDENMRYWYLPNEKIAFSNIIWSSGPERGTRDKDPLKQGELVNISLGLLKDICKTKKKHILTQVILKKYPKGEWDELTENRRVYYYVWNATSNIDELLVQ